jgi:PAS domain S-box-containing protein
MVEDTTGRIIEMNRAAEQRYGWPREELLGQSMHTLVPEAARAQVDSFLVHCRQGNRLEQVESVRQTRAGDTLPVRLTVFPLMDEQQVFLGIVTLATHQSLP